MPLGAKDSKDFTRYGTGHFWRHIRGCFSNALHGILDVFLTRGISSRKSVIALGLQIPSHKVLNLLKTPQTAGALGLGQHHISAEVAMFETLSKAPQRKKHSSSLRCHHRSQSISKHHHLGQTHIVTLIKNPFCTPW